MRIKAVFDNSKMTHDRYMIVFNTGNSTFYDNCLVVAEDGQYNEMYISKMNNVVHSGTKIKYHELPENIKLTLKQYKTSLKVNAMN